MTTTSRFVRALTGSREHPVVDVERHLAAGPAEVWDALVQPERLARWLGTIESGERPAIGDAFTLRVGDGDRADCTLLACDAERELAIAWRRMGEPDSVVRVAVEPAPAGTVLRLRHELVAQQPIADHGAGWEGRLDGLGDALAGLDPRPFAAPALATWQRMADGVLQVERVVDAPIETVWAAFATLDGLRSWWWRHWSDTTIDGDLRVGGSIRIAAPAAGIVLVGEVLALDPVEHRLAATWAWSDADGTSVDEAFDVALERDGSSTRVVVRHSGPWADEAPAASYRQGWEFVLGELAAVVGR